MKIIHQNGFSREELLTYRLTVYRNLVDSAQAIVLAMRKIGIDCETPSNRVSGCLRNFRCFFFWAGGGGGFGLVALVRPWFPAGSPFLRALARYVTTAYGKNVSSTSTLLRFHGIRG